jgi:hypothetical protein
MDTPTSPTSPGAKNDPAAGSGKTAQTSNSSSIDFQQVLSTLLMASSLSNIELQEMTSGSDSSISFGGDMMMPVLFSLIEQLLEQQINSQAATSSTTTNESCTNPPTTDPSDSASSMAIEK